MAYRNKVAVYIDGINRTARTVLPIKWGDFLDERLDECHLSLRGVQKQVFAPLTPVDIVITSEMYFGSATVRTREQVRHYIIANDSAEQMQAGGKLYNHDLYLIEVTKASECNVVDTLTFTNDLGRSYTKNAPLADPAWE